MAIDPKISILTFPQKLIGNTLHLNVLIIPRNIDPFEAWTETGAPAWVDANLQLQAFAISGLEKFPFSSPSITPFNLPGVQIPAVANKIFSVLQNKFNISSTTRLQPPKPNDYARKYLPVSYRTAFNFTNPRTDDAVIDDSYHCAIKANKNANPAFVPSTNAISWGEVFAYCLRQPALARKVGFIQQTSIVIDDIIFKDGGWLFVDIDPGGSYGTAADKVFLKRYAARIPALKVGVDDRNLFAAIQFPVKVNEGDPDPLGFDEIYPEASAYDDGFAKIVHANQPVSADLLKEEIDDHPPIHDIGIRLAWDDEQLLIWKNRQLRPDPADITKTKRFDAPMGTFQYHIDAKEKAAANWISLNLVENRIDLAVDQLDADTIIAAAGDQKELGVEVYPAKLDGFDTSHYWLPAYFTQWTGKSLVVPDRDAALLHKTDEAGVTLGNLYKPLTEEAIDLQYGKDYEFRVRLSDPTGGGPGHENIAINNPIYESPSPKATCKFRRHVVPQPVHVRTVLPKKGEFFEGTLLEVQRPRLGYPSVVFTGKYGANVINLLTADRDEAIKFVQDPITGEITTSNREFGLHDPDVEKLEICVEIKALEMDTLLSKTKTESYIHLYTTTRNFTNDFAGTLSVAIEYVDAPLLQFTNSPILQDLGLSEEVDRINIHDIDPIVLPTARNIRITMKCVCHNALNYFGSDVFRYGKPLSFMIRRSSNDETHLIKNQADTEEIKGVYLQPDTELLTDSRLLENSLLRDLREKKPDLIQRLADAIGVETRGFSLVSKPGRRIQFGCSKNIRNSISPDGNSITFSTKADLLNQWIVPIKLLLNRDWTWDALEVTSFEIERRQWFKKEPRPGDAEKIGDIEMKKIISIQALQKPDRSQTWLIFLDAVEPKPAPGNHPDLVELEYVIKPVFKNAHANDIDPDLKFELELPVVTPPAQIPKIVSAGVAFTKYNRNKNYSASEPREKYLWLEFKEPIQDPNDAYFVRMLAYAPDPLLSDWRGELFIAPKEPPLPIIPELIRTITIAQPHDNNGLDKMQELTMVTTDPEKRHFLVPLPHGLHSDSNEMFGFFTYEIRVGHRDIWSTEQGRYGREIRTTGVQHPAPTLYCTVTRDEKRISVSAPYAMTVSNGKNVTSRPPRTQIWSLLYAQVYQADGRDFRNILLNDRLMVLQPETKETIHKINEDAQAIAVGGWTNKEIITLLRTYGLPEDSPLSIVCVEMLPVVFSLLQTETDTIKSSRSTRAASVNMNQLLTNHIKTRFASRQFTEKQLQEQSIYNEAAANYIKPLSDQLGNYRMLRTSPLTAVPAICCVEC